MKILLTLLLVAAFVGCTSRVSFDCEGKCNVNIDRDLENFKKGQ